MKYVHVSEKDIKRIRIDHKYFWYELSAIQLTMQAKKSDLWPSLILSNFIFKNMFLVNANCIQFLFIQCSLLTCLYAFFTWFLLIYILNRNLINTTECNGKMAEHIDVREKSRKGDFSYIPLPLKRMKIALAALVLRWEAFIRSFSQVSVVPSWSNKDGRSLVER